MIMKWNLVLNIPKTSFKINILSVLVHKNHWACRYFVIAQQKQKSGKPVIADAFYIIYSTYALDTRELLDRIISNF
jgi:hypothetical protein